MHSLHLYWIALECHTIAKCKQMWRGNRYAAKLTQCEWKCRWCTWKRVCSVVFPKPIAFCLILFICTNECVTSLYYLYLFPLNFLFVFFSCANPLLRANYVNAMQWMVSGLWLPNVCTIFALKWIDWKWNPPRDKHVRAYTRRNM